MNIESRREREEISLDYGLPRPFILIKFIAL